MSRMNVDAATATIENAVEIIALSAVAPNGTESQALATARHAVAAECTSMAQTVSPTVAISPTTAAAGGAHRGSAFHTRASPTNAVTATAAASHARAGPMG